MEDIAVGRLPDVTLERGAKEQFLIGRCCR